MDDAKKTKAQLIAELEELRKRNAEFYTKEAEYKKVDEELLKRSQLFKTMFHNAPIGLAINEIDGNTEIIANETFREAYKVPKEACKTISDFFAYVYGDRMVMGQQILDDQASGDPARMRWDSIPIIDKETGETSYVSAINLVLKDHNLMISTVLDITERKKAEEALRVSEEKFRVLYNNSPDMYVSVSPDDLTILLCNDTFLKKTGYSREDIVGASIFKLYHEDCMDDVKRTFQQFTETGVIKDKELLLRGKDGSKINVSLNVNSIKNETGKILHSISSLRDITEHKQLEDERAKASKLESIGLLAGGIAHDFNNILTVILGNTSLAKIRLDNKEEVVALLTETEKASVHATKLTQQLLTFAKGGAPVKEITVLTELIRETTQFSLRGSNVQYRTSITPDLWAAEVDKGQISQVIGNLVINAQQAMPEGGTINIKANNVTVTSQDILQLQEGNYIKISIEDKGTGITEDHLSKIFDPYFTTKLMGNGLGLATVYSIIQRHSGHITVETKVGTGTTFTIYLPASAKQIEEKGTGKENSAVLTGKILVMDDEEMVRNFVLKALKSFGNDVDEASDGAEAIKKYKKAMDSGKPFDVVIMDLTIPGGMGGQVAIKKLLEIDPDAKAVVSSGYANDPVISNFDAYGFKGYIPKPYKLEELKKVLNEVMSGAKK